MKTIEIGPKTYRVAENWAELTPAQYRQLIACPRLNSPEHRTLDNEAAVCFVWLGIGRQVWHNLSLTPWQWGQLRQQFAWLFETKPEGKPPMASFLHKGVNYHLPNDGFSDTTAVEIAMANMAFVAYAHPDNPDSTALARLVATLCRPRRTDLRKFQRSREWNGDRREPFTEQRMMERAADLADLDIQTALIVLDYFERMNVEFMSQYGELFGSNGKSQVRYDDGRGWLMLLKNVAKQGHFGDFDKVCQQPAHLLFATLLDDLLDKEEADANQPQPPTHENY